MVDFFSPDALRFVETTGVKIDDLLKQFSISRSLLSVSLINFSIESYDWRSGLWEG